MKMFRKVTAIVLASFMCCCIGIQSAASASETTVETAEISLSYEVALNNAAEKFIDEYPNYSELINKKLEIFLQDRELKRVFDNSPDDALVIFNRAIEIDIEISGNDGIAPCMSTPVDNGLGTLYYCTVDASIVQGYDSDTPEAGYKNWCGVGSTLMALTGIETYHGRHTQITIDEIYNSVKYSSGANWRYVIHG